MISRRFNVWLRNISETQDEEISCTECFDLVSRFVELEMSGGDAGTELPQVKQHLDQCRACRDEYELLRVLARLTWCCEQRTLVEAEDAGEDKSEDRNHHDGRQHGPGDPQRRAFVSPQQLSFREGEDQIRTGRELPERSPDVTM